eukprot:2663172-Amphidinium_carterae.1
MLSTRYQWVPQTASYLDRLVNSGRVRLENYTDFCFSLGAAPGEETTGSPPRNSIASSALILIVYPSFSSSSIWALTLSIALTADA